jgi:curved DNA-binding protein CbpA
VQKTTEDHYKLLGLPRGASQDDIRKAHRRLVRQHHPDANPKDPRAEERFKEIQQAYEVLSDPQKRREYDEGPHAYPGRGSPGRPRARGGAGERTGGAPTPTTVDLSELLEKLKIVFGHARTGGSSASDEDASGEKASGGRYKPKEKRVKGPKAQRKEKRVKGPSTRRKRESN